MDTGAGQPLPLGVSGDARCGQGSAPASVACGWTEADTMAGAKARMRDDPRLAECHSNPAWPAPWRIQRVAECLVLQDFSALASAQGLALPPDTPVSRKVDLPDPSHEVVALAQHHEVPTSLLDFS